MHFNFTDIKTSKEQWDNAKPFNHIVIDNFLPEDIVEKVAEEFPHFDDKFWFEYSNPLEIKKACSDWNKFPPTIYQVFMQLLSENISEYLSLLTNCKLQPDYGLHGGGLHTHKSGGKLNTHLDYSIHPKINLQRKVNIIVYVSKNWKTEWNGDLGLWSHDDITNQPKELVKKIDCIFNRAVIFDTTKNSWHGLPTPVTCPDNKSRNSLATYYLCEPPDQVDVRGKALYAPAEDQKNDESIKQLIEKRASITDFSSVYITKE